MRPHELLPLIRVLDLLSSFLRNLLALVGDVQLVDVQELAEGLEGVRGEVAARGEFGAVDCCGEKGAGDAVDGEGDEGGL